MNWSNRVPRWTPTGGISVLGTLGVDTTPIVAGIGLTGVTIGFASREVCSERTKMHPMEEIEGAWDERADPIVSWDSCPGIDPDRRAGDIGCGGGYQWLLLSVFWLSTQHARCPLLSAPSDTLWRHLSTQLMPWCCLHFRW